VLHPASRASTALVTRSTELDHDELGPAQEADPRREAALHSQPAALLARSPGYATLVNAYEHESEPVT
jgi:hypothetical protein